jgi:uncharacterized circularly permuted ATP-grasp superfamily protein
MSAEGSNDLVQRASVIRSTVGKPQGVTATSPYPPSTGFYDERMRAQLIAQPEDHVAQPTIESSLHPTVIDGELVPRHVDVRPFVFLGGEGKAAVTPGGLTRVAFGEGAIVVNSTQNGGAKDTWVLP